MTSTDKWFKQKKWKPYPFQRETWAAIASDASGLLNAPTGYGKTFAIWFGVLENYLRTNPSFESKGLHCLYLTPLRALSKEIKNATDQVSVDLGIPYKIGLRTGDTTAAEKAKQKKKSPEALITTPESVHLMLTQKGYAEHFKNLEFVIVDEWHELLGSKRGVQVELALSRLRAICPHLKVWGISATIGNLELAKNILLGEGNEGVLIRSDIKKKLIIETVVPDTIEKFPWAGHLGLKLADKVLPLIEQSRSTLIFTNTRSFAETWFRHLLEIQPDLAGQIGLHHGSLSEETRKWVEDALHEGLLKVVVCTSSLDLGVDFRPVDTVIQIGSAKGVARFMQRAGRSGHSPGATSRIYFVPTHSLEIIEGAALRYAVAHRMIESRIPFIRSFDVLIQYLVTLAISDGFRADEIFDEVKNTHCYESISREEFDWCLSFIVYGGDSLTAYDEFHKVLIVDGLYHVTSKAVAMRHRLNMGTIVGGGTMFVKFLGGKRLGSIEEWFISRLNKGDVFWFGGRSLELVMVKNMEVFVRAAHGKKGITPSWMGGRMPLSSELSNNIRHKLDEYAHGIIEDKEIMILRDLFELQARRSYLPSAGELLIEKIKMRNSYHVFVYPFEGRAVHEGMAAILANRMAQFKPITFSVAMNDYGFELVSDQPIPIEDFVSQNLFSTDHITEDVIAGMNISEMAMRRFRDIASIAGLVFTGYPGRQVKTKHLQASAQLFFKVFEEHENNNLLLRQAFDEVFDFQLEITRLRNAFERISQQYIVIKEPDRATPFCFPILTDSLREKFSSEELSDRIAKMKAQAEKE